MQNALVAPPKEYQKYLFDEGTCFSFDFLVTAAVKTKYVITVANYLKFGQVDIGFWVNGTNTPTPPSPTPAPATGPVLYECVFPSLQWNLMQVLSDLVAWIGCILHNIIAQLDWIIQSLATLIPQLLAFLTYVVTLKWLTDFLAQFFDRLDTWLSAKFGIDKDKPFFDELLRKALDIVGGAIDDAARNSMKKG